MAVTKGKHSQEHGPGGQDCLAALSVLQRKLAETDRTCEELLELVLRQVLEMTHADGAAAALLDRGQLAFCAAMGSAVGLQGVSFEARPEEVIQACSTGTFPQAEAGADIPGRNLRASIHPAALSCVGAPVPGDPAILGAIWLFGSQAEAFNIFEIQALVIAAGLASESLSRALRAGERRRSERIRTIFSALGQKLSAATDPRQVAVVTLETADELFGWDSCFLDGYLEQNGELRSLIVMDTIDGQRTELEPNYAGPLTPITRKTWQHGPQLVLRKEAFPPNEPEFVAYGDGTHRSASLMFVPIRKDAKNIGILSIQSYSCDAYTPADLELLQTVANYCSSALERTLAESKLHESELRYRTLVETAGSVIVCFSNDYRVLEWNQEAERVYACKRDEVLGRDYFQLFPESENEASSGKLSQALAKEWVRGVETVVHARDGHDRVVLWNIIRPPNVRFTGILAIGQDITDRKTAERERVAISRLGLGLAASDTVEKTSEVVRSITEELWAWDAFVFSVRDAGYGWLETVLQIDTIDGVKCILTREQQETAKYLRVGRIEHGEPLLINREPDYALSGRSSSGLMAFGDTTRLSASLLYAPIRVADQIAGLLSVQSYTPNFFGAHDRDMLQRIADAVGPAVERCQAEKRSRMFASLGKNLNSANNPVKVAHIIADAADHLVGWDACCVSMYSPDDDREYPLAMMDKIDGRRTDVLPAQVDLPISPIMRRTMTEGAQLILRNSPIASDERFRPFGDVSRLSASLIFVPIQGRDGVVGVLTIQSYTEKAYDQRDLSTLQALADQCSGALERTRAEMAFREAEMRFGNVVESMAESLIITDPEDRIVYANSRTSELTGYLREDIIGRSAAEIVIAREEAEAGASLWERAKSTAGRYEAPLSRRDGSQVWVEVSAKTFTGATGEVLGILAVTSDISERKRSEREREILSRLSVQIAGADVLDALAAVVRGITEQVWLWDAFMLSVRRSGDTVFQTILEVDTINGSKVVSAPEIYVVTSSVAQRVVSGEHVLVNRSAQNPVPELLSFGDTTRRSASLLYVPVRVRTEVLGILSIQSYTPNFFSNEDCWMLQRIADAVGPALERCWAEEALRESEERYALAVSGAMDGIWDWNLRTDKVHFSSRWKEMLGYAEDEIGDNPQEWFGRIHPEDAEHVRAALGMHLKGSTPHFVSQHRMLHKDGGFRWVLIRGATVRDESGKAYRMAGSQSDVTVRKKAEEELQHGAFHDPLTGLPNRALLIECVARCIARAKRREDYMFAVLFLDLDRFKILNESLGHFIGDQLLVGIARRLESCLRPEDTIARLGGDEFAVLLEDVEHIDDVNRVAERIQHHLSQPFALGGHEVFTTASIGIALSTRGYEKPEDILRDSDTAMYRAKAGGKARHEVFNPDMHSDAVALLQLETDLWRAIERREFTLYYQPIIALQTGRIHGFEALVRWLHPRRGLISPSEFIPIAEETGLILPIGWWVIREAAHQIRKWQIEYGDDSPLSVSVNLSGRQFADPDLVEKIAIILEETNLDPRRLVLEITESVIMENAESLVELISRLKALEIELHIDDFGTGYSSLSYLHRFPIDKLKIDRSFISQMNERTENAEIARAIVTLAHTLGMGVIAEGIESQEHVDQLKEFQCECGQGFYFCRPLNAEAAGALLSENRTW